MTIRTRWVGPAGMVLVLAAAVPRPAEAGRKPAEMTLALTGLSTFHQARRLRRRRRSGDDGGLGGGSGQIVGRVSSLMIDKNNYGRRRSGAPACRRHGGRMRAEGFIKAGATMQAQNLTANVTWKCR